MLTKEDALRVILARIAEWDVDISGVSYFDDRFVATPDHASVVVRKSAKRALDHG